MSRGDATSTGTCPIRRGSRSRPSGARATRSSGAWPSSRGSSTRLRGHETGARAGTWTEVPRPLDTGFPTSDAQSDFSRARRQRALATLAARLRRAPGDVHPRVSVARAQGRTDIDAYVTEVTTRIGIDRGTRPADLPLKSHERLFRERVPLSDSEFQEVRLSDPWQYGALAEGVEAWGFRHAQGRR